MLTVVTGPPCVGKSTYVRERAQSGDLVVDLDTLALALTVDTAHHDYPTHVRRVAMVARRAAVSAALAEHHRGARVWIVHARPTPATRAMYHQHRATLVDLAAPASVLLARAEADRPAWVAGLIRSWHAGAAGDEE